MAGLSRSLRRPSTTLSHPFCKLAESWRGFGLVPAVAAPCRHDRPDAVIGRQLRLLPGIGGHRGLEVWIADAFAERGENFRQQRRRTQDAAPVVTAGMA